MFNNRFSWWFVLHDSEENLKELENSWEPTQLQTDWKIESCYMPVAGSPTTSSLILTSQTDDTTEPPPDKGASTKSPSVDSRNTLESPSKQTITAADRDTHDQRTAAESEYTQLNLEPAHVADAGNTGLQQPSQQL